MSTEGNKALVLQFPNGANEVWKEGDIVALVEESVARDLPGHDPVFGESEFESSERELKTLRDVFLDMELTIDDMVADGDKVAARKTLPGTH